MGSFEARKIRTSKLPMPPRRSRRALNLTVLRDEFRVAGIERAGSRALVGRKDRYQHSLRVPA